MKLTTLGIDAPPAPRKPAPGAGCPSCGAKERVDGGGFGGHTSTLCAKCGYEFKEGR